MPAHTQKHAHKIVFIHYAVSHLQECSHSVFQVSLSSVVNKHIGRIPQIVLKVWSNLAAALLLHMNCGFLLTYFYCFHLTLTSVMNVKWFLLAYEIEPLVQMIACTEYLTEQRVENYTVAELNFKARASHISSHWLLLWVSFLDFFLVLNFSLCCATAEMTLCGVKHFPR